MRIAVSAGHNVYNGNYFDCGSIGNGKRECDITRETVKLLIPMLKAQGHIVLDVTPYNERFVNAKAHHKVRCERADKFKADMFIDVHINAGGGTGVEAWVYSRNSKAYPYAEKICNNISKNIGIPNRGVKINPNYWSVSLCKAPAIIVEGAFIDNKSDMQKLTPLKYAKSIVECFGEVKKVEKKEHWAEKHFKNLNDKGIEVKEKRFNDNITRGEVMELLDRATDRRVNNV